MLGYNLLTCVSQLVITMSKYLTKQFRWGRIYLGVHDFKGSVPSQLTPLLWASDETEENCSTHGSQEVEREREREQARVMIYNPQGHTSNE